MGTEATQIVLQIASGGKERQAILCIKRWSRGIFIAQRQPPRARYGREGTRPRFFLSIEEKSFCSEKTVRSQFRGPPMGLEELSNPVMGTEEGTRLSKKPQTIGQIMRQFREPL